MKPTLSPASLATLLAPFGPLLWSTDDHAVCPGGTLLREGRFHGAVPASPTQLIAEQIASLLQITPSQITRLTARGLPHYRLGHRTLRFSKPEVLHWLRQTARVAPKEQTHGSTQEGEAPLIKWLTIPPLPP